MRMRDLVTSQHLVYFHLSPTPLLPFPISRGARRICVDNRRRVGEAVVVGLQMGARPAPSLRFPASFAELNKAREKGNPAREAREPHRVIVSVQYHSAESFVTMYTYHDTNSANETLESIAYGPSVHIPS